jgi:hypothetical protein
MGYFQYSAYTQCKLMQWRQQSGCYSALALPTTAALPPECSPESADEIAPRIAAAALDVGRP